MYIPAVPNTPANAAYVARQREAFLRGIAWCLQIRGVYYAQPGLDAAVEAAVHRLHHRLVNRPVLPGRG